ncbi:MAG: hypothetical protein HOQ43_06790 [Glycomyces artemisiae]|uniref:Uncharacterized protein n=1 Tax=Glycomyces artemisiae TaxID=1076443 RepID=A0A850C1N8_9ACTN|nr:hypothetical protein [Glycomyces artemisiae]
MKPTAQRRRDRRDLLDVLLGRMLRGVLTVPERALLAETVREEQRTADQTRRSLGETSNAYGKHRAAADAAIREAEQLAENFQGRAQAYEQRALDAEEQLTAYRAFGEQRFGEPVDPASLWPMSAVEAILEAKTRAEQAEDLLRVAHKTSNEAEQQRAAAEQALGRSENAREHLRRRYGEAARAAEQAEAVTAETKRLMDRRTRTLRERAERAERDLATLREGVRECGGDPTTVQNVYAQLRMWRNSAQQAEHRAARYRLAWMACRRDRKADRAAMADEAHIVAAAHRAARYGSELFAAGRTEAERELGRRILAAFTEPEPTPTASAALTVDEAADNLRQWAAAGIPAADLLAEPDEPTRPVSLGRPCAYCGHARNHHPCGGPCCVGNTETRCGCPTFTAAEPAHQ